MRLLGLLLLVTGFLLCVSIVWATIGFLMMGFGLICLMIAERQRQRLPKPDMTDFAAQQNSDAVPRMTRRTARQPPAAPLEPTFADIATDAHAPTTAAPFDPPIYVAETRVVPPPTENTSRADGVSERLARTPWRATPRSEFDRIRVPRASREAARTEPESEDFAAPVEQDAETRPPPTLSPSVPSAAPPAIMAAPPITIMPAPAPEPKPVTEELRPETARAAIAEDAERAILFDDEEDLAEMFSKFDLGKDAK